MIICADILFLAVVLIPLLVACSTCSDRYFLNEHRECAACPEHCLFCDSKERCLLCENGYWGNICERSCTYCMTGTGYEKTNGVCEINECIYGYSGILCYIKCESKCLYCNREHSAICAKCAPGRYPVVSCCNETCAGCQGQTCDCSERCVKGSWGQRCERKCPQHCKYGSCDKDNGTCIFGCNDDFMGLHCNGTRTDSIVNDTNSTVVVITVILLVALIALLVHCRKRSRKKSLQDFELKDAAKLARDISKRFPAATANLILLLKSLSNGEAFLQKDEDGRIKYKHLREFSRGLSNRNVIAQPKSKKDIKIKLVEWLKLIDVFKLEDLPSGVLLDRNKISLTTTGEYRLDFEYEYTGKVLGKGNIADGIRVIKDKERGEHACKTMPISWFRKEEISCWVAMTDTGCVPALYMFRVENCKVSMHMEKLDKARTLRDVIDKGMKDFLRDELKPFSLLVLYNVLRALKKLHSKGWVHKDLHAGNIMVQNRLKVKLLDFGQASRLTDCDGLNSDILGVLRIFTGIYTGSEDIQDIKRKLKKSLTDENVSEFRNMSKKDRRDLYELLKQGMKIGCPAENVTVIIYKTLMEDTFRYRMLVQKRLKTAMRGKASKKEILKKVADLLSKEESVHQPPVQNGGDASIPPASVPTANQPASDDTDVAARNALLAEIKIGAGLKKVTDGMKTHNNPALRTGSSVTSSSGVCADPVLFTAASHAPESGTKKPPEAKTPVLELQDKKWVVEYQVGNKSMVINETNIKQAVYMFKCQNCTLQIKGKLNSIIVDSCKKLAVVFDDVVSSIEFVNCQNVQAQVIGKCPTVSVDKTDGFTMYLSKDSLDAEIITAKSSEMNVLVPKDDGDFEEFPLPEQFKTIWNGKKFTTGITESV